MRDYVLLYLNGRRLEVRGEDVFLPLAEFLRYRLRLVGTKIVCAEGDCGACTVLTAFESRNNSAIHFQPINSCISLVGQLDGSHILTIEGLGQPKTTVVQKAVVEHHGTQCGYCTPGFVMSLSAMFDRHKNIDEKLVKDHLTGNLCRCTGYSSLIEAGLSLNNKKREPLSRFLSKTSLNELRKSSGQSVKIQMGNQLWLAPTTVSELRKMLKAHPSARLLSSGTDFGVILNKGRASDSVFLSLHLIKELYGLKISKGRMKVGARVTISELRKAFHGDSQISRFLDIFASPQIKNMATLVGNIANASPIADTPAFLLSLNAKVEIMSAKTGKIRQLSLDKFYLSYKKTALENGECITALEFEIPEKSDRLKLFKASQRRDLDISCVNAGFWMRPDDKRPNKISEIRIALGGVAEVPKRLYKTEALLRGKTASKATAQLAIESLQKEIEPISDLRASSAYRRVLAENYLRAFLESSFS